MYWLASIVTYLAAVFRIHKKNAILKTQSDPLEMRTFSHQLWNLFRRLGIHSLIMIVLVCTNSNNPQ
jgi:hypothetical protein